MTSNDQIVKKIGFFQDILQSTVNKILNKVDVRINGTRSWDMQIHDEDVYFRILKFCIGYDRLAMGESYMDGQWSCEDLVAMFEKCLRSGDVFNKKNMFVSKILHSLPLLLFNMQSRLSSKKDVSSHYDIGNDLFKLMLDQSMNYSCAYWENRSPLLDTWSHKNMTSLKFERNDLCRTLDEAQMNKMLLIARKLKLEPGMKVLDIGSGWGYLAKFLAVNFGVHVIGITISNEQYQYAITTNVKQHELEFLRIPGIECKSKGNFEFRLQDYRDVDETFDRIFSVGMIEHVGKSNFSQYFDVVRKCLTDDGLFLLHTIGIYYHKIPQVDPWANKYIFPNGMIPYHKQLIDAFYGKFIIEDWHNLGYDYYRTLICWHENFKKSWPRLEGKYSDKFYRMWTYYLLASASIFKTRKLNLWQIVLSKRGIPGGYVSYR